jgi:hypothetical protein
VAAGSPLRRPVVAALICFALALPVLAVLKSHSAPHYAISHAEATKIARSDPRVAKDLAEAGYTKVRVSPFDDQQQRVSFFNGPRIVLHALVGPQPKVSKIAVRVPGTPQSGNTTANAPALLIGMSLLFVLVMASVPLLSLRNLDVLAFASLTLPVWLLNEGFIYASVLVTYPLLAYLVARLLWSGLGGARASARSSLYWHLTADWRPAERSRLLKLVLGGLAIGTTILTLGSTGVSDVAFAGLAGATDLIHGTIPYGHIPDFIVHGDTYPPLTYVLYVPAAAISPVTNLFSDPEGALVLTAVASLLVAWLLYRAVARAPQDDPGASGSEPPGISGLRAATAWLAYPPVLLAASSGTNDILLAVFLVAALASVAHRGRSAVYLAVAAWVKFVPVVVMPIWLARLRGRQLAAALAGVAVLSFLVLGSLVALGGPGSLSAMAQALSFQFGRGSLSSLWWGLDSFQPAAQAALLAIVVAATLAVRQDDRLRDDLPRLAAILAGVLLLTQFAANYWTWAYLPWAIAPALFVLVPAHEALQPERASDWTQVRAQDTKQFSGTY